MNVAFCTEKPEQARSKIGAGGFVLQNPLRLELAAVAAKVTPHPQPGIGEWANQAE